MFLVGYLIGRKVGFFLVDAIHLIYDPNDFWRLNVQKVVLYISSWVSLYWHDTGISMLGDLLF